MDFFLKNLKEVLEAINALIELKIYEITTKRVKKVCGVKSSNRSQTTFIARILKLLEKEGILEKNGSINPVLYKIPSKEKVEIEKIVSGLKNKKIVI